MKHLTLTLVLLTLSACASGQQSGKPLPEMTFQHIQPLNVPVSEVIIQDKAGQVTGHQAEYFTVPYERVVRNYVDRKFQPAGGDDVLAVTIETISVGEQFEDSANKVANFLGVAGFEVYDVRLGLNIAVRRSNGAEKGVRLNAARRIKVSEHASIAERERKQFEGLEEMFRDLDASVTRVVLQDLQLIGPSAIQSWPEESQPSVPEKEWPSYQPPVPLTGGASGASTGAIERQEL